MPLLAFLATAAAATGAGDCPDRARTAIAPDHGRPSRIVRVRGSGFAPGRRVYVHVRRKGRTRFVSTARLGRTDACGAFEIRRRALAGLPQGIWTLQLDTRRRASTATVPRGMNDVSIGGCFRGIRVVPCYTGLARRFVAG